MNHALLGPEIFQRQEPDLRTLYRYEISLSPISATKSTDSAEETVWIIHFLFSSSRARGLRLTAPGTLRPVHDLVARACTPCCVAYTPGPHGIPVKGEPVIRSLQWH